MGFWVNWYSGDRGGGVGVVGGVIFSASSEEGGLNVSVFIAGRDGADGAFVEGEGC